ncbi:MAG: CRP/FNR family cyclic AMP-dependent transcriptional regulator [Myxococcota bacterium]|jgi:CRP/FNR family cyclic AMP-dependent transcriptional regulator
MEWTIEALQGTATFAGVSTQTLEVLLDRGDYVVVNPGEAFFNENDFGDSFYLLEEGEVEIFKTLQDHKRILGRLGVGDCFGEMALLAVTCRSASVVAVEPCVALKLSNRTLHKLYDQAPQEFALIVMNLGREVCRRLRDLNDRLLTKHVQALGVDLPIDDAT